MRHIKRTQDHINAALGLSSLRTDLKRVSGFNAKFALFITQIVGTMWCFYAFLCLSLVSLPAVIASGSTPLLIQWLASTCLQLILLPALMVGQNLQNVANDARADKTVDDVSVIMDRLDIKTEGGLKTVLDAVNALQGPRVATHEVAEQEVAPGAEPTGFVSGCKGPQSCGCDCQ